MIHYTEVTPDVPGTIALFREFYDEIYSHVSMELEQRKKFDNFMERLHLKHEGAYGNNNYHIILMLMDDEVIGGAVFNYFTNFSTGFIECLHVKDLYRSGDYGNQLHTRILKTLQADANRINKNLFYIFHEVNRPDCQMSYTQRYFWNKQEYRIVNFDYVQPDYRYRYKDLVCGLQLAVLTMNRIETVIDETPKIFKNIIIAFLYNYTKYITRISDPYSHVDIRYMCESIQKSGHSYLSCEDIELSI